MNPPYAGWDSNLALNLIRDGSSNTIAFGTRLGHCAGNGTLWAHGGWTPQWMAMFAITNNPATVPLFQVYPTEPACNPDLAHALSPAGMPVGLADASVRFLDPAISQSTWAAVLNPGDGVSLPADWTGGS